MDSSQEYSSHVTMLPGPVYWVTCDRVLSILLILFSVLALLGNSAACTYFQSNKKTGIAPRLYTMICAIDIATSLTGFPVAVSLFAERKPVMFDSQAFCTIWNISFRYLQIISMYLVLLLSITRCILISFPFYTIWKQGVIASFVIYTVFLMTKNLVVAVTPSLNLVSVYSSDVAYCYDWFGENGTKSGMMIKYVAFTIESGIPPILTFFSFLITVIKISSGSGADSCVSQIRKRSSRLLSSTQNEINTWTPMKEVIPRRRLHRTRNFDPRRRHSEYHSLAASDNDKDMKMRRYSLFHRSNNNGDSIKVTSTKMTSITKEKRKASVTVAIFTMIFLLCNLPFFIVVLKDIVSLSSYYDQDTPDAVQSLYIAGYSWILSRLHFTVLNAMLNPIMYCFRMEGFRFWLLRKLSREERPPFGTRAGGESSRKPPPSPTSHSFRSVMVKRNLTL
jgi:hypothetical protein